MSDDLTVKHYKATLYFVGSLYLLVSFYIWSPILFGKGSSTYDISTLWVMTLGTFLGAFWLLFARFEALYLETTVGQFVPKKYSEDLSEIAILITLWGSLMFCAVRGWVFSYSTIYLAYVLFTTLFLQPHIGHKVASGVKEAQLGGRLSHEKGSVILNYYHGFHWKAVGGESVAFASMAAILAWNWDATRMRLLGDLLISPHLPLTAEMLASQGIILYCRYMILYRGLDRLG